MTFKHLLEYGKIGLGTMLTSAGISYDLGVATTKATMEEAMYRTLTVVNPETLVNAKMSLDSYINNGHDNSALLTIGIIVGGSALLASGIYNLARNCRIKNP